MAIYVVVRFTLNGVGVTGLSPTITVYDVADASVDINAQTMTAIASGYYKYDVESAITLTKSYVGLCNAGTDSVDQRYIEIGFDFSDTSAISNIQSDVTSVQSDISTAQADITDILADVSDIPGDVATSLTSFGAATEAKQDAILAALTVSVGARLLTVTVLDDITSLPIIDTQISVYPALNDSLITTVRTDINGEVGVSIDDGAYRLVVHKVGYEFTNPISITITGNTSQEIQGTAVVITSPAPSTTCRVYEYLYDLSGVSPLASSKVLGSAAIYLPPFDFGEDRLIESTVIEGIYSSSTGLIYWDVAQEAIVSFRIPIVGFSRTVEIPESASARLYDLLAI